MTRLSKAAIAEKEKRAAGAKRVAKSRAKRTGWRRVEIWMPDSLADELANESKAGVVTYVGEGGAESVVVEICTTAPLVRFHSVDGRISVFKMVRSTDTDWKSSVQKL